MVRPRESIGLRHRLLLRRAHELRRFAKRAQRVPVRAVVRRRHDHVATFRDRRRRQRHHGSLGENSTVDCDQDLSRNPYESVRVQPRERRKLRTLRTAAAEGFLDGGVTLAGGGFQAGAVQNEQPLVTVLDHSCTLQSVQRDRHAWPADAEHGGQ